MKKKDFCLICGEELVKLHHFGVGRKGSFKQLKDIEFYFGFPIAFLPIEKSDLLSDSRKECL
jgi:hypothetical protein